MCRCVDVGYIVIVRFCGVALNDLDNVDYSMGVFGQLIAARIQPASDKPMILVNLKKTTSL
jgi:hypothetical protein